MRVVYIPFVLLLMSVVLTSCRRCEGEPSARTPSPPATTVVTITPGESPTAGVTHAETTTLASNEPTTANVTGRPKTIEVRDTRALTVSKTGKRGRCPARRAQTTPPPLGVTAPTTDNSKPTETHTTTTHPTTTTTLESTTKTTPQPTTKTTPQPTTTTTPQPTTTTTPQPTTTTTPQPTITTTRHPTTTTTPQPTTTTTPQPTTTTTPQPTTTTTLEPTTTPIMPTTVPPESTTPDFGYRWPFGKFSLMMAGGSCPDGGKFVIGRRYHDLESRNKWPKKSAGLSGKMNKRGFELLFCSKINEGHSNDWPWPKGSYCIHRFQGSCPNGFSQGTITIDDDNNNNKNWQNGTLPDGEYNKDTQYIYCCRKDGKTSTTIDLPYSHPFYLYPSKTNKCQNVRGMTSTKEKLKFDTENTKPANQKAGVHPKVNLNKDVTLNMCLYQPDGTLF